MISKIMEDTIRLLSITRYVCLSRSICLAVGLFAYISHLLTFESFFFFLFSFFSFSFLTQNPFFSPQGLILDYKLNSETSKRSILTHGIRNYKNTTHPIPIYQITAKLSRILYEFSIALTELESLKTSCQSRYRKHWRRL